MDFENYDMKIEEELAKTEEMEWEMYYRTLLSDQLEQVEREYNGAPEDKAQELERYRDNLIVRHAARIQRLLDRKREKLTQMCFDDIINQIEKAECGADTVSLEDVQSMQLDIITGVLKIHDYDCLEKIKDIVKETYE